MAYVVLAGMGACSLYPELPPDNAKGTVTKYDDGTSVVDARANFDQAITYATESQQKYRRWMVQQEWVTLGAGTAATLMGGAALGLGAVGGSSVAVTALGAAAGTTIALDTWVIGSPSKSPKFKAYQNGIVEIQCVINAAMGAVPKPQGEAGPDTFEIALHKIVADNAKAESSSSSLAAAIKSAPPACEEKLADARLNFARGVAAQHRAGSIETALAQTPRDIVASVHTIDVNAFTQADAGALDISQLPKVSISGGASKSSGVSTTLAKALEKAPGAARPTVAAAANCTDGDLSNVREAMKTVADDTATLKLSLSGIVIPQPVFAACIKPPSSDTSAASNDSSSSGKNGSSSKPPSATKPSSPSGLSVLPSLNFPSFTNETSTIAISGGTPPYDLVIVDPDLETPSVDSSGDATKVGLKVIKAGATNRLLVTDSSGHEQIINVMASDKPKNAP